MKTLPALAFLPILLAARLAAGEPADRKPGEYGDPTRMEKEIKAFEAADAKAKPPEGAIVCTGSSSMRGWRGTIQEDLAPLTVIPRGFGGSNTNDLLHFADRVVLAYQPRAVVVYEGDNDIKAGIPPEKIAATFKAFVEKVHARLPEARVYVLSIKPSPSRWELWPAMQATNELLKAQCEGNRLLTYIDVAAGMLDGNGQPKPDLYQQDRLHLVRKGYEIWRDAVRPVLLAAEEKHEKRGGQPAGNQPAP
jgi:lysophospholipase L1-like esterase